MFCGFEAIDDIDEFEENRDEEVGSGDDDDSSDIDREEIEIALYSKVHFLSGDTNVHTENNIDNVSFLNKKESVFDNFHTSVFVEATQKIPRTKSIENNFERKKDCLKNTDNSLDDKKSKGNDDTEPINQKKTTKTDPSHDQVIVISESESETCSKYNLKPKLKSTKSGLSQDQAVEISDAEHENSNKTEWEDFICIDIVSSSSDPEQVDLVNNSSDTDEINSSSSASDSDSSSSHFSKTVPESIRIWSRDDSQLHDMVLDESSMSDPGDLQFNVSQGQRALLLKTDLLTNLSINKTEDDKWAISEKDVQPVNPMITRYYNPITVQCFNCRELGHISNACPKPKKVDICHLCGNAGHFFRNCPRGICYNCNAPADHIAKDCPKPHRFFHHECHRCLMYGHGKTECPDLWRQYHRTTTYEHFNKTKEKRNPKTYCYNCASSKHYGFECPRKRMDKHSFAFYPFIALYYDNLNSNKRKKDFHEDDEKPNKKMKRDEKLKEEEYVKPKARSGKSQHRDDYSNSKTQAKKQREKKEDKSKCEIMKDRGNEREVRKVKPNKKGNYEFKDFCVTVKNTSGNTSWKKNSRDHKTFKESKAVKKSKNTEGPKFKDIKISFNQSGEKDFPRTQNRTVKRKYPADDSFARDDFKHQAFQNQWWEGDAGSSGRKTNRKKKKKDTSKRGKKAGQPAWKSNNQHISERGFKRTHF